MVPSEGIEPPAEEPESSVLSITPRGQVQKLCKALNGDKIVVYAKINDFSIIQTTAEYFKINFRSLYLTFLDYCVYDKNTVEGA